MKFAPNQTEYQALFSCLLTTAQLLVLKSVDMLRVFPPQSKSSPSQLLFRNFALVPNTPSL